MIPTLFFYAFPLVALVWLFFMRYGRWPHNPDARFQAIPTPQLPRPKRSRAPKPFAGLRHKPPCALCEPEAASPTSPSPSPPTPMPSPPRRPRSVNASLHFCPHPSCDYRGWVGLGHLRANGHPNGGPWRPFHCTAGAGYFLETHGTIFHGKRGDPQKVVWAVAALAEGLGIRAVARVFEVDPKTVVTWLVEAAAPLQAFSRHVLHDVQGTQVQLEALFALLSAVKDGTVTAAEALQRRSCAPHGVWVAMDPVTKLILTTEVGDRTLARAQRVGHQVAQGVAPDCAPLFLTDGFRASMTALLTPDGRWVQPPRKWAQGVAPKPRWRPLPQGLYAQVVKQHRRRRLVGRHQRGVLGPLEVSRPLLAKHGWPINPSFSERLN